MAAPSAVGSFPSPYEVETPPGCEGWEEMYPYYARFDEERREADEQRFWFWNSMHFPVPMPAFDAICIDTAYQALGAWQNRVFAVPPAMGIDYRCINGYIYISGNPVTDPAKIAERAGFFQQRAGYYYENWDELYGEVAHEDGRADRGARRAARPGAAASTSLTRSRSATRRRATATSSTPTAARSGSHDLMWQHHFEFLLLGYGAYMTFAELCKAQPAGHPRPAHRADGRRARRAAVQARRGAAPAGAARDRHGRRRGVRRGPLAGGDRRRAGRERRRAGPGSRSSSRSRTRGSTWPRATASTTTTRSWLDDPSIPYASLIGHIAALAAGEEIERPTEHIAHGARPARRPSTARCSTTRRGKGFERAARASRARSSPTSRSTSSSATTGSSRAGGTRSASSATCSSRTASSTTATTSSSSRASRCTPRSTSSC